MRTSFLLNSAISAVLLATIVTPITALAFSKGDLKINSVYVNDRYPTILVYELKPGETFEDEVIISKTEEHADIDIYVQDGTLGPKGETDIITQDIKAEKKDKSEKFLPEWMQPEFKTLRLEAGEKKKVKLKISIPINAEKKEYVGKLFVHEEPKEDSNQEEITQKKGESTFVTQIAKRINKKIILIVTDDPKMPNRTLTPAMEGPKEIHLLNLSIITGTIAIGILLVLKEKGIIKKHK